jgi:hypothetical protein
VVAVSVVVAPAVELVVVTVVVGIVGCAGGGRSRGGTNYSIPGSSDVADEPSAERGRRAAL